jgi:hypothetical protein
MLRSTVESVRSRCQRETGSLSARCAAGVGQAEVAFRVLEVDRIDLVRHGRRADLASLELLLEEAERDVAPEIAVQVDQDQCWRGRRRRTVRPCVVRLDLNGVGIELEPERFDEAAGELSQS